MAKTTVLGKFIEIVTKVTLKNNKILLKFWLKIPMKEKFGAVFDISLEIILGIRN